MADAKIVPVLWLDLDGTVRHGPAEMGGRFVQGPEDVQIFDGVPSILSVFRREGWRLVGITNQGGVALGHVPIQNVQDAIRQTNLLLGNVLELTLACYHHPDATEIYMRECWCRKPQIGMLLDGVAFLRSTYGGSEHYVPSRQALIGDMESDKQCAESANVRFMFAKDWRAGQWETLLQ